MKRFGVNYIMNISINCEKEGDCYGNLSFGSNAEPSLGAENHKIPTANKGVV